MPNINFNTNVIHPSFRPIIKTALKQVDQSYLQQLKTSSDWLPGPKHIFNAFSIPLSKTRFILFGESPYPRLESANGYAFWDNAVNHVWSDNGLSKTINRATSLRHLMKTLLIAEGLLSPKDTTPAAIAAIDKSHLIATLPDLFQNIFNKGFLLLNASLVLQNQPVMRDAQHWQPFMESLLQQLTPYQEQIQLILFGKIASQIKRLSSAHGFQHITAEHPYNISFMHNSLVVNFFQPLHLLKA